MAKSQLHGRGNQVLVKMSWYFVEIIMPLILTSAPGPLAAKQPQSINDPPPYLMVGMRCFSFYAFLFWRQTCRRCTSPKSSIFGSSDHTMFQAFQWRLANSRHLNLLVALSKGFLCATLPKSLLVLRRWYSWFWYFVTPRGNWSLQFLNCRPRVLHCLPQHVPYCVWGQHALASSSWQVWNGMFKRLPDLCRSTTCLKMICLFWFDSYLTLPMVMDD